MAKTSIMNVQGIDIALTTISDEDYISLTDIIKAKDGDFFISDWLRNRNTLEYLGAWETMFNPDFNYGEFDIIKSKAGLNNFKISIKEWHEKTNAIGIVARVGRYGGTYAHKDIAFNFCMWISPAFQLYVVREYQRLVELERSELPHSYRCHQERDTPETQHQPDETRHHIRKRSRPPESCTLRLHSQAMAGCKPRTRKDNEHQRYSYNQSADRPLKHRIPQCRTHQARYIKRIQTLDPASHSQRTNGSPDSQKRRPELCRVRIRGSETC